jgi:hypothetical protein
MKGDIPVHIKISGLELTELQRYTGDMSEAFGLDGKLQKYKGTRPISLHRWDLDCILAVLDMALDSPRQYPSRESVEYLALSTLRETLRNEYSKTYGN